MWFGKTIHQCFVNIPLMIGTETVVLVEADDGRTETGEGHRSSLYWIDQVAVYKQPTPQ